MIQVDFWNESCPECAARIPFAPPGASIGYVSHLMNWREFRFGRHPGSFRLRICIRGVPKR